MKLDKIKFAELIGYCANRGMTIDRADVIVMDDLIDIDMPQPDTIRPSVSDVNRLMELMTGGDAGYCKDGLSPKIEAIRMYRNLTGQGLKESKDQVEKYWISKPVADAQFAADAAATLGDILDTTIARRSYTKDNTK